MSSMSVILHELLKLVHYARCQDPLFIRLGTSGGIGVDPGTVVVSKKAFNGYLRNEHEIVSRILLWCTGSSLSHASGLSRLAFLRRPLVWAPIQVEKKTDVCERALKKINFGKNLN